MIDFTSGKPDMFTLFDCKNPLTPLLFNRDNYLSYSSGIFNFEDWVFPAKRSVNKTKYLYTSFYSFLFIHLRQKLNTLIFYILTSHNCKKTFLKEKGTRNQFD